MNANDNKKSFLLYIDTEQQVNMLTNCEAGILYKAIIAYAARGEELNTSFLPNQETGEINARLIDFAFKGYKSQLDRDAAKWEDIRCKRKEAGKIGGYKKAENLANLANARSATPTLANNSKSQQTVANLAVSVSVSDSDSVSVKQKEINKEKKVFKKPSIEEVSAYISEIGANIYAADFVDFYDSKGWMVGSNHMKDWKAALRTWQRKRLNNMTEKTPSQTQTEDPQIASFKSWAALNTPYIYSRMVSHDFYEIKRIAESKAVSQILSLMEKDHFMGEIIPEFKNRYSLWEAGALK